LHFMTGTDQIAKPGEMCVLEGKLTRAFGSSMEVAVVVAVADVTHVALRTFCHAYFVYVVLKEEGEGKVTVPQLVPQTTLEYIEYDLAEKRKEHRKNREKRIDEMTPPQENTCDDTSSDDRVPARTSFFTELVLPVHANHMGNTFGGQIMHWMTKGARSAMWLHLGMSVNAGSLKASPGQDCGVLFQPQAISQIHFKNPSHIGDRIVVRANVTRVFQHRVVEILVKVSSAAVGAQDSPTDVNEGFFTFEVIPVDGKKDQIHIPDVRPETVELEKQYRKALARHQWRMQHLIEEGPVMQADSSSDSCGVSLDINSEDGQKHAGELATMCISAVLRLQESTELGWQALSIDTANTTGLTAFIDRDLDTEGALTRLKISSKVKRPPQAVYKLLWDLGRRRDWDKSCLEVKNRRPVGEDVELCQMVAGSTQGGKVEMNLLRCFGQHESAGSFVVGSRSIKLDSMPVSEGCIPGELLPTGYIIDSIKEGDETFSVLTFIGQFRNRMYEQLQPFIFKITRDLINLLESERDLVNM